jgi:hypothetical protein
MLQKLFQAMSTPSLLPEATTEAAPEIQGPGVCNFIGMEYYAGILNRTYLVCAEPEGILGYRARGLIASPSLPSPTTRTPLSYVNPRLLGKYQSLTHPGMPEAALALDRANFVYLPGTVYGVTATRASKWGMGNVRYSGRIIFTLTSGSKREFILLGAQPLDAILGKLERLTMSQSPVT